MNKERKPSPNKIYVQITSTKGDQKFRRYSPEKYKRIEEILPDDLVMIPLRKEHWKDRRKNSRKKWRRIFSSWMKKHRIELTIFISLLALLIATIALFIKC